MNYLFWRDPGLALWNVDGYPLFKGVVYTEVNNSKFTIKKGVNINSSNEYRFILEVLVNTTFIVPICGPEFMTRVYHIKYKIEYKCLNRSCKFRTKGLRFSHLRVISYYYLISPAAHEGDNLSCQPWNSDWPPKMPRISNFSLSDISSVVFVAVETFSVIGPRTITLTRLLGHR